MAWWHAMPARLPSLVWLILALLIGLWLWQILGRKDPLLFRVRQRQFLTPNELDFAKRLAEAVEPSFRVMAQVSMGALIEPLIEATSESAPRGAYLSIRARYAQKVVDFVIADQNFRPLLLIELDDSTHDADRDAWRDAITTAAGYTTLRYESRAKPSPEQLRRDIRSVLSRPMPRRGKRVAAVKA